MTSDNFTIRELADGSGFAAIFDEHPDAAHLIYYDVIEGLATRDETIELFRTHGGNRAYAIPVSFLEFAPEVVPGADLPTTPGSIVEKAGRRAVRVAASAHRLKKGGEWHFLDAPYSTTRPASATSEQLAGAYVVFDAAGLPEVLADWEHELLDAGPAPEEPEPTRPYNALRVRDDGKLDDLGEADEGVYADCDGDLWIVDDRRKVALLTCGPRRAPKSCRREHDAEDFGPYTRVDLPEGTK